MLNATILHEQVFFFIYKLDNSEINSQEVLDLYRVKSPKHDIIEKLVIPKKLYSCIHILCRCTLFVAKCKYPVSL